MLGKVRQHRVNAGSSTAIARHREIYLARRLVGSRLACRLRLQRQRWRQWTEWRRVELARELMALSATSRDRRNVTCTHAHTHARERANTHACRKILQSWANSSPAEPVILTDATAEWTGMHSRIAEAVVTSAIRLEFDRAIRPFDDLRYNRKPTWVWDISLERLKQAVGGRPPRYAPRPSPARGRPSASHAAEQVSSTAT